MKALNEFLNEKKDTLYSANNVGQAYLSVFPGAQKQAVEVATGLNKYFDGEKSGEKKQYTWDEINDYLYNSRGVNIRHIAKIHSELKESLNEATSKFNLKDFEFYKSRNYKGQSYSFYHKPTELEADIYLGYGSFGRGSSERTAYVDYLEFVEEPDEDTVSNLEMFIENNLDYIFKNAEKIG